MRKSAQSNSCVKILSALIGYTLVGLVERDGVRFAEFKGEAGRVLVRLDKPTTTRASKPKVERAPKRVNRLYDTRIVSELYLDGASIEDVRKRNNAIRRAYKTSGDNRSIEVAFADGSTFRVGNYIAEDKAAFAEAIRCARSRHMEQTFSRLEREYLLACRQAIGQLDPWRQDAECKAAISAVPDRRIKWRWLSHALTSVRVAPTPLVAMVRFVPKRHLALPAPEAMPIAA